MASLSDTIEGGNSPGDDTAEALLAFLLSLESRLGGLEATVGGSKRSHPAQLSTSPLGLRATLLIHPPAQDVPVETFRVPRLICRSFTVIYALLWVAFHLTFMKEELKELCTSIETAEFMFNVRRE